MKHWGKIMLLQEVNWKDTDGLTGECSRTQDSLYYPVKDYIKNIIVAMLTV